MKLAAALALALCACSSGGARPAEPADVDQAQAALRFGDLAQAERELAVLYLDDVPRARRAEVFWAGWFLANAHARLAFEPARDVGLGGGAARAAHAQAALYHARRARLGLEAAPDLPPQGLEFAGGRDDAALGLDLLELALEGLLGFDERVARMLEADAELSRPGGAARRAQAAQLEPRLATCLELALFEYWDERDAQRAFEFAVGALAASDAQAGLLGEREVAQLEAWIRTGAGRPFRCPECRQPAVPELRACPNDQTPLIRFRLDPAPLAWKSHQIPAPSPQLPASAALGSVARPRRPERSPAGRSVGIPFEDCRRQPSMPLRGTGAYPLQPPALAAPRSESGEISRLGRG